MGYRPRRMKFGTFVAPFHRVGEHPTLALKRDMATIELLDDLGYDEAWIGEHHSFGRELISNPMIFIASAAERTRSIKLGTGVTSIPYHHPLMVADDLLQLDHMTRGRVMLGCGPGALTSDAYMMGIEPSTQRRRMAEGVDAIMALLRADEPVSMKTDWFELRDARLQMAFYSDPHPEVACAVIVTPTGPMLAGRNGMGLLSVAGFDSDALTRLWGWVEEGAAETGRRVSRDDWRIVVPMHLAESRAEAVADVAEGYKQRAYFGDARNPANALGGLFGGQAATIEEAIERGAAVVGTPDDAIAKIEELQERSGGFGSLLVLANEWANSEKTAKSYELLMRYAAPRFQGQLGRVEASRDWVEDRRLDIFGATPQVMAKAFADHGKELPEVMKRMVEAAAAAREAETTPQPSGG